jgi:Domain of unknown function (DUF6896)
MDERLAKMIVDYQSRVAEAVTILEKAGFRRPVSAIDWVSMEGPPHGELVPGYRFYKHGFGCAVQGPGWAVDFDFGKKGQIDGIDPWHLKRFVASDLAVYRVRSEEEVDDLWSKARRSGELDFSGDILFYVSQKAGLTRR